MSVKIEVQNLSKVYRLGESESDTMIREALMRSLRKLFSQKTHHNPLLWALNDINFQVSSGELVGIVGRNGAGKSTLLKVLSRITWPTAGTVTLHGRTAAMLEVGTGFHQEMTGRENIYLNGSIMGMKKREIDSKLDEIVAFAGVEKFLETPIKRYSSGMRMRLGFAVAAHLESDILLVDEVLAVGDSQFQKKCLETMSDLRTSGRTVLFVSHNMAAIENLCNRTLWIDNGQIRQDGPTTEVITQYMATFATAQHGGASLENIKSRTGNGEGRFTGVEFLNPEGQPLAFVRSGEPVTIRLHFRLFTTIQDLRVGIELNTSMGVKLAGTNNWATGYYVPSVGRGEAYVDLEIDSLNVMAGRYYLSLWLGPYGHVQDSLQNAVIMDVETSDYYGTGRGTESHFGLMLLPCRWTSDCLSAKKARTDLTVGAAKSSSVQTL